MLLLKELCIECMEFLLFLQLHYKSKIMSKLKEFKNIWQ